MQQQKLKLLFLASWYPTREHRTLGNFVQRHAEAVSHLHQVCALTAVASTSEEIEIHEKGNLLEIKVYFKKRLPVLSYRKAMKKGLKKAEAYFTEFDLVHVHVAYPAGMIALKLKQPYVVTEHFSGYHKQSKFKWGLFSRKMTLRILKKAEIILPVSDHLATAIGEFGASTPMKKVSNVVNPTIFHHGNEKNARFTFLHVSTLEERSKNITGILKAFKKLEKTGIDFLLKIGGDGDLEELQSKIKTFGPSQNHVEIFEEKPLSDIANLMRSSHAYVMFSHFENQPTTILEALCCGLPVVSSDVGGIPEEITAANGILVPAEDEAAFVAALKRMAENRAAYNSDKIANAAMAKYSYAAVAEEMSDIYFNVLK